MLGYLVKLYLVLSETAYMCFRVAIPFALPLVINETFCVLCHCHDLVVVAFEFSHFSQGYGFSCGHV